MNRPARPILRLIEVVSVLGIVAFVGGSLVQAVSAAREAARRAQCVCHQKCIVMAVHNYADTFGTLPQGTPNSPDPRGIALADRSYLVPLLPYMECHEAYALYNMGRPIVAAENRTLMATSTGAYLCPSDLDALRVRPAMNRYPGVDPSIFPVGATFDAAWTSYRGVTGQFRQINAQTIPDALKGSPLYAARKEQADGCFHEWGPVRFDQILDGTSNTLMAVEVAQRWRGEADGASSGWAGLGATGHSLASAFEPPNARRVGRGDRWLDEPPPSSRHPGGINAMFADGSIRFVRDAVGSWAVNPVTGVPVGAKVNATGAWSGLPPAGVWQQLATIDGGEPPPPGGSP